MKFMHIELLSFVVVFAMVSGCGGKQDKPPSEQLVQKAPIPRLQVGDEKWEQGRTRRLRIQTQVQTKYSFKFGKPAQRGAISFVTMFDTLGRKVTAIPYYAGSPDFISRFYYNRDDRIVLEKTS